MVLGDVDKHPETLQLWIKEGEEKKGVGIRTAFREGDMSGESLSPLGEVRRCGSMTLPQHATSNNR